MKMNLFAMSVLVLMSVASVFAAERDASKETKDVIAALLSHSGAAKVAEFAKYADTILDVKIDEMEDVAEYRISGIKLQGGDVPCGNGTLTISKSFAPQFGVPFSTVPVYQAEVSGQSNCR